jgi:hypothetical protein
VEEGEGGLVHVRSVGGGGVEEVELPMLPSEIMKAFRVGGPPRLWRGWRPTRLQNGFSPGAGGSGSPLPTTGTDPPLSPPARQFPPTPTPKVGDHVRVLSGAHKGETGMVVAVERGVCAVLGDATKAQFRVNARDLTEDVDTGEGLAVGGGRRPGVG